MEQDKKIKLQKLPPIYEIRNKLRFHPQEITSHIKYFKRQNIDWDVYLTTKKRNLQREKCWTLQQKIELITSILIGRHIPHCAIINNKHDVWEIIDGKQRLSTMVDFTENKFAYPFNGDSYFFNELPEDYQLAIERFAFRYYVVNETDITITDEDRIAWFKYINYAGTPQDEAHLKGLS